MREEQTGEEKGGTISADTLRRIYLLTVIGGFRRGVYGAKRLHKISYIAERQMEEMRPFEFKKYHHGQYSETLEAIKDQLISLGLVKALPMDTAKVIRFELPNGKSIDLTIGGNTYVIADKTEMNFYRETLAHISPKLQGTIGRAIKDYGYLREEELLKRCYDFPEFVSAEFDQIIFESTLPDRVNIPNLSPDDCEELELSLNPIFTSAMAKIVEGMEQSEIDLGRIEIIDKSL